MIIGHCYQIPYMPFRHLIFTYHMPFFFLASGYCYKSTDIKNSLKKDLRHLMIPYFITCLAILFFYSIVWIKIGNNSDLTYYLFASIWGSGTQHTCLYLADYPKIGAIWFLPALLICKNLYNMIKPNKKFIYSSILFIIATILGRYVLYIPFSFLSGVSALIFFAIGDYLKKIKSIKWYWLFIGLVCWYISFKYSHIYMVQPQYDLYFIDVIGATTASVIAYFFSKLLSNITIAQKTLSWVGRNTLLILCLHLIDLDCHISPRLNFTSYESITIIYSVLLPILGTIAHNLLQNKIKQAPQ